VLDDVLGYWAHAPGQAQQLLTDVDQGFKPGRVAFHGLDSQGLDSQGLDSQGLDSQGLDSSATVCFSGGVGCVVTGGRVG